MTDEERLKIIKELEKVDKNNVRYFIEFFQKHDDLDLLNLVVDNLKNGNQLRLDIKNVKDMKAIKLLNENDIEYNVFTEDILFDIEVLCYNVFRGNLRYLYRTFNYTIDKRNFSCNEQHIFELIDKYNVSKEVILSFIAINYIISLETFLKFDEVCRLEYKFQSRNSCRYPLICSKDKDVVKAMLERGYRFQTNPFSFDEFYKEDKVDCDILKLYIEYHEMKSFINPLLKYSFEDNKLQELIDFADKKYGKDLMRSCKKQSLIMHSVNIILDRTKHADEDKELFIQSLNCLKNSITIFKNNNFRLTKEEKEIVIGCIDKFDQDKEGRDKEEIALLDLIKDVFIHISSVFDVTGDNLIENKIEHSLIFNENLTLRQCRKLIKKYGDINIVSDGVKAIDFHYRNYKIVNKIVHNSQFRHMINSELISSMSNKCFKKYLRKGLIQRCNIYKFIGRDLDKIKTYFSLRQRIYIDDFNDLSEEVIDYIIDNVDEEYMNYNKMLEYYLNDEEKFFQIVRKRKINLSKSSPICMYVEGGDEYKKYDNYRDYFLSKECNVNVRKYLKELK